MLLRKLFTYGYHDNVREQRMRLENIVQPGLHFVAKNNVYITMPIYHILFNIWERCISFMKKASLQSSLHMVVMTHCARATLEGNEQGH